MSDDRRQILEMLAQGKITADEAERLLTAVEKSSAAGGATTSLAKPAPKYLRVVVETDEGSHGKSPTKVNVRVPLQLLRAGVKLASIVPAVAKNQINEALRENGIDADISKITPDNLDELIQHLNELTVDVDESHNKVRIFCE